MTDVELGRAALRHFHNSSIKYDAYSPESLDDLTSLYGSKRDIYLDGVGLAIRVNNLNDAGVQAAMGGLAEKSQGKIPKDHQGYVSAIGNKAGRISYLDMSKVVLHDVTTQVQEGVTSFGSQTMTTLSWLNRLMPFLVVGGVIFFIYSFGKNNSTVSEETKKKVKSSVKKTVAKVKSKVATKKKAKTKKA